MAYSNKLSPIFKAHLEQLKATNEAVEWQTPDPSKFAYKLREALTANKDEELKARFIIKVLPGKVRATPRFASHATVLAEKLSKIIVPEATDLFEIVGAVLKHKGRELYFPNSILEDADELKKLYLWCGANGYYMVKGDGITLTVEDPGEVAWKPF